MTHVHTSLVLDLAASSAFLRAPASSSLRVLKQFNSSAEARVLQLLAEHRLQHLFWDALQANGHENLLSEASGRILSAEFRDSQISQANYEWHLISVADALTRAGVGVIACKGAVLARHYYPRTGLRIMHDIDFWLLSPDVEVCRRELTALGFFERTAKAQPDAHNFIDAQGVVLDVHVKMRLFQDKNHNLADLSQPLQGLPYRVFSPEAQVAHLVSHLLGHASQSGVLICWLIDIALVLRKNHMDPWRVKDLLRDDGSWFVFLRMVRSFAELGWIDGCMDLDEKIADVRPFHWDTLVRQRRRSGWSGIRGKLRLGKTLALGRPGKSPFPRPTDLLWQPVDWFLEENPFAKHSGALLVRRKDD